VLAKSDPEPQYFRGALMAFCGQEEIALRLLKTSIGRNYCAYSALQVTPCWRSCAAPPSSTTCSLPPSSAKTDF